MISGECFRDMQSFWAWYDVVAKDFPQAGPTVEGPVKGWIPITVGYWDNETKRDVVIAECRLTNEKPVDVILQHAKRQSLK